MNSTVTFADHRVWRDVCHGQAARLVLYVKLQADVVTAFQVMTFKER